MTNPLHSWPSCAVVRTLLLYTICAPSLVFAAREPVCVGFSSGAGDTSWFQPGPSFSQFTPANTGLLATTTATGVLFEGHLDGEQAKIVTTLSSSFDRSGLSDIRSVAGYASGRIYLEVSQPVRSSRKVEGLWRDVKIWVTIHRKDGGDAELHGLIADQTASLEASVGQHGRVVKGRIRDLDIELTDYGRLSEKHNSRQWVKFGDRRILAGLPAAQLTATDGFLMRELLGPLPGGFGKEPDDGGYPDLLWYALLAMRPISL